MVRATIIFDVLVLMNHFPCQCVNSILRQEVGWFDTCGAGELTTKVSDLCGTVRALTLVAHKMSSIFFPLGARWDGKEGWRCDSIPLSGQHYSLIYILLLLTVNLGLVCCIICSGTLPVLGTDGKKRSIARYIDIFKTNLILLHFIVTKVVLLCAIPLIGVAGWFNISEFPP